MPRRTQSLSTACFPKGTWGLHPGAWSPPVPSLCSPPAGPRGSLSGRQGEGIHASQAQRPGQPAGWGGGSAPAAPLPPPFTAQGTRGMGDTARPGPDDSLVWHLPLYNTRAKESPPGTENSKGETRFQTSFARCPPWPLRAPHQAEEPRRALGPDPGPHHWLSESHR